MKTQTIKDINNLIVANKKHFVPESSMSEKDFLKMASTVFGLKAPKYNNKFTTAMQAHKYALQKVAVYTKMNKLLAKRGLVIRSKNYYTEFHIVGKEEALDFATAKVTRSVALASRANTIQAGVQAFNSSYTKLTRPEQATIPFEV